MLVAHGDRGRRDRYRRRRRFQFAVAADEPGEARAALRGIYALIDSALTDRPVRLAEAALGGGARILQYRAKTGVDRDLVKRMYALARAAGALLIVNDDVEAALDADGVHVGQEDLALVDVAALRGVLGSRVLGVSCSTPQEAREAERVGADYVGAGPFAFTSTKADAGAPLGAGGIRNVVAACALPVAAIGGIGLDDLPAVARSGAVMAAIAGAIARSADPAATTRALVTRWNELTR